MPLAYVGFCRRVNLLDLAFEALQTADWHIVNNMGRPQHM
jgi:hypothetical protein